MSFPQDTVDDAGPVDSPRALQAGAAPLPGRIDYEHDRGCEVSRQGGMQMFGFSPAAQQLEAAAGQFEQFATRLDVVAMRGEDCLGAVFASADSVRWDSPAGQAFTAMTFHHVRLARERQESVAELAGSARTIAGELAEHARLARTLAAAIAALAGAAPNLAASGLADPGLEDLLRRARGAGDSAESFLRFLRDHGGLPVRLMGMQTGSAG
ncbi:hypothetical protein [Nesterenkonia lutea]|uniref:DUF222 domain-containing protein n=1 Tax=Nesterenkonia lutea TaxID=272919 RepID=A0ABR9JH28_9MICC|nr:hypothetical protein [Nesterenkonia lutea]MBE1524787.1 hypothetical protein [Nesterenkonia lutea]